MRRRVGDDSHVAWAGDGIQVCFVPRAGDRDSSKLDERVLNLPHAKGGRHAPFFGGYTPQFFFRTTDVTGATEVPGDAELAMPGDGVRLGVRLGRPIALAIVSAAVSLLLVVIFWHPYLIVGLLIDAAVLVTLLFAKCSPG